MVLAATVACGDAGAGGSAGTGATSSSTTASSGIGATGAEGGSGTEGGCSDQDNDGFLPVSCGGGDCDDDEPTVHPGNDLDGCGVGDEDCDGEIDEDPDVTFYRDRDSDGFGSLADSVVACTAPDGYVSDGTDCDDDAIDVHPGAGEVCDGIVDDNCDGNIDEGCDCVDDATRDCVDPGAIAVGFPSICTEVTQTCVDGTWPGDCSTEALIGPSNEACEGTLDENCDGVVDEGCLCVDNDTQVCGSSVGQCTLGIETCTAGMWTGCTGVPPTAEVCDHLDQNCDNIADDGVAISCSYTDATLLADEFFCLPGTGSCSPYTFGNGLQLGWSIFAPWVLGSGEEDARAFYLPTAVDFSLGGFVVETRTSMRRAAGTALGDGVSGVMISPSQTVGTEVDLALPRLGTGEIGFAAAFFSLPQQLAIFELRDSAGPLQLANTPFACPISTSDRDVTVRLEYAGGDWTATASAPGCTTAQVSYTTPVADVEAMYGSSAIHPHYFPGVFGDDRSGGTILIVEQIDVMRTSGCDGCPW